MSATRSTPADLARRALAVLGDELPTGHDPGDLPDALHAARDLLRYPRATWPSPANPWEALVLGLALATLRVESSCCLTGARALSAVGAAVETLRTRQGAA